VDARRNLRIDDCAGRAGTLNPLPCSGFLAKCVLDRDKHCGRGRLLRAMGNRIYPRSLHGYPISARCFPDCPWWFHRSGRWNSHRRCLNATNGITKSSNLFDHAIFVRRGCPALIFGWCNINRQLEAYQLVPHIQTRVIVNSNRVDPSEPVAIGAGIEQFTKLMEELRGGADRFGRTARLPLLAVEDLVTSEVRDDVGGDVQIRYATSAGFQIMTRVIRKISILKVASNKVM
jgi:hypothetical protein